MKRLIFCILVLGFLYGGIKAASAEPSLILSTSADIRVSATVINPVGFVTMKSERESQITGRAFETASSREISVLTSGNNLLKIEYGQRKFFLITSEDYGYFTFDNNLLWSNNTSLNSFIPTTSAEQFDKTTSDSSLCLITLITISD